MNKNNNTKASPDLFNLVQRFSVPIMFILICAVEIVLSLHVVRSKKKEHMVVVTYLL